MRNQPSTSTNPTDIVFVYFTLNSDVQNEQARKWARKEIQKRVFDKHGIFVTEDYVEANLIWSFDSGKWPGPWTIIFSRDLLRPNREDPDVRFYNKGKYLVMEKDTNNIRPLSIGGIVVGWAVCDTATPTSRMIKEILIHRDHVSDQEHYTMSFGVTTTDPTMTPPPAKPGFYKYSDGNQDLIFLLTGTTVRTYQWWAFFSNGNLERCSWSYIEQGLGGHDLVRID